MDGGIDDLVPEGHCHLETLKLNMGGYLMKTNRGEHMLGKPPLEKEMHGRKEKERQSKQRTGHSGRTYLITVRWITTQFGEGISFFHSCVFVSKASTEALCHYHQQGQEQENHEAEAGSQKRRA